MARRASGRPLSLFTLLLLRPAHAALPPAAERPAAYANASNILAPPPLEAPSNVPVLERALVTMFRWVLQQQSGVRCAEGGFPGLIREMQMYREEHTAKEFQAVAERALGVLSGPMPYVARGFDRVIGMDREWVRTARPHPPPLPPQPPFHPTPPSTPPPLPSQPPLPPHPTPPVP